MSVLPFILSLFSQSQLVLPLYPCFTLYCPCFSFVLSPVLSILPCLVPVLPVLLCLVPVHPVLFCLVPVLPVLPCLVPVLPVHGQASGERLAEGLEILGWLDKVVPLTLHGQILAVKKATLGART